MLENENKVHSGQAEPEDDNNKKNQLIAFVHQLKWAMTWLVSPVALCGGLIGMSAEFAKTAKMQIILACAVLVGLAVLLIVLRALFQASRKKVPIRLGLLVAIAAVTIVTSAGVGRLFAPSRPFTTGTSSAAGVSSTTGAAFSSTTSCAKALTIVSPTNGTKIVGHKGVKIRVVACGLTSGESGWLFDLDTGDGTYGLDNGGPVATGNGTTTFDDTPVGDQGDVNEGVKLTLVLADSACTTALDHMDIQNTYPTSLPASCRIESQVEVIETY